MTRIGIIPADGIGKEVIPAAQLVLSLLIKNITFIPLDAGFDHFTATGVALPQDTINKLKTCDGALFGAVSSPSFKVPGYSSPIVALRKHLDLYANVRPITRPPSHLPPLDILIIRENTECLYIKSERIETDSNGLKTAYADRKISQYASQRIARVAFKMALQRHHSRQQDLKLGKPIIWTNPPKLTIIHKSNVLSITDGLFRESVLEVQKENPDFQNVVVEEQLVDSMVYRLFREPHVFDVCVAPNLYGDIISDAAAALVGSLGLVGSANVGDTFAMGEPVHGSAPDIQGKGIANPIAAIRSAAMLMEHLGYTAESSKVYASVNKLLIQDKFKTPDLGGKNTTTEITDMIIKNL